MDVQIEQVLDLTPEAIGALMERVEHLNVSWSEDMIRMFFAKQEEPEEVRFYFVLRDGAPVGVYMLIDYYLATTPEEKEELDGDDFVPSERHIAWLVIDPEHQKSGIGLWVMRHIIEEWAESGPFELSIRCKSNNTVAVALYESLDFKLQREEPNYYEDGTSALFMMMNTNEYEEIQAAKTRKRKRASPTKKADAVTPPPAPTKAKAGKGKGQKPKATAPKKKV